MLTEINQLRERSSHLHLNGAAGRSAEFSIESNQIKLFTLNTNITIGYCTWLSVTREAITRLNRTGIMPYHWHEWSEGKITLLSDIFFDPENHIEARRQFLLFLRTKKIIAYYKNNRARIVTNRSGKLVLLF